MSNPSHFADADRFSQLSDEFMCWLRQHPGVRVSPKIRIADLRSGDAGRGVVACDNINEDEELFAIPQDLVLSFQNSKLKEHLGISENELGPWLCLILVMVHEYLQGGASPWARYFHVLPTKFDTLMFWTDAELQELKGSSVLNRIGKSDAEETILRDILPLVSNNRHLFPPTSGQSSYDSPDGKARLLSLSHRMGSLIMAYAFDIEKGEDEDMGGEDGYVTDDEEQPSSKGMVPLADLLNADADRNNARLFQEDGYLAMKSIKPIRNGEEIFNDYGELPRADLLRRYGYVTDNYAQYDEAEVPMRIICKIAGLGSATPSPDQPRLEFLEDLEVFDDGYSISRLTSHTPLTEALPDELLIVLRTLTMPDEQFSQLKKEKGKAPKSTLGAAEVSLLAETVRQTLSEYPTTIARDEELLASFRSNQGSLDETCTRRFKMAIQVRKGEKEVLSQVLDSLEQLVSQQSQSTGSTSALKRGTDISMGSGEKRRKV
ncbi:hypothetical protein AJ79_06994 [Helicocarpus griseus UAMH5409]|uniref:SET domain-containing protein n=1 Tax=Helicocarpus griseus UAMH5409 TaxID=1447875 RepID=A0A2B7X7Q9_9EURO|nr:hypothetical protein AJ79_06994 [Helicocarpus griseus UAMH5409]